MVGKYQHFKFKEGDFAVNKLNSSDIMKIVAVFGMAYRVRYLETFNTLSMINRINAEEMFDKIESKLLKKLYE